MPFAHCPDCGSSALIDPSGRCPEGHTVGAAGARVAAAIGSARPHPDEPQPWVRQVQLEPDLVDETPLEPRAARPLSVPTAPEPTVRADQASTDDLMRELHALGDLGDLTGPTTPAAQPAPPSAAPTAPTGTTPPPTAATPAPAAATPPSTAPAATPEAVPAPRPHLVAVPPLETAAHGTAAPAAAGAIASSHAAVAAPTAPANALEDTRELDVPSAPLFGAAAVSVDTPAPPSSPDEATDLASLANLAAAVRSLDERGDEAPGPAATPAATPVASTPDPGTPPPPPPSADPAQLPPHAADPGTAEPPAEAEMALVTSAFDGSFTAKGGGRARRADARPGKRGLFRR